MYAMNGSFKSLHCQATIINKTRLELNSDIETALQSKLGRKLHTHVHVYMYMRMYVFISAIKEKCELNQCQLSREKHHCSALQIYACTLLWIEHHHIVFIRWMQ
jgi:hypothetical protein